MNARSRLWAHNSHSVGRVVLSGPSTIQHQTTNCKRILFCQYLKWSLFRNQSMMLTNQNLL